MKFKTTLLLAIAVLVLGGGVYIFEYQRQINEVKTKEENSRIISFEKNQINFIEIQKEHVKYVLQKSETGWDLLEPIQDSADNEQIETLIDFLTEEKMIAVAKESEDSAVLKLAEYGLDNPYAMFNFKNNLGKSKKVFIGSQKNFEGNSFLRIDSENKVLVASPGWWAKADQGLINYREKRLYRSAVGKIDSINVQSLQDKFELKRVEGKWIHVEYPDIILDQNKVREMLKQITDSSIQEYVFDGEPSKTMLTEKKLIKPPVLVKLQTPDTMWSVGINQNEKDNAVFAITERPTNLLKLDNSKWEFFGNLNFDSLRDRTSLLQFNLSDVTKIFFKDQTGEFNFVKESNKWKPILGQPEGTEFSQIELVKALNRIHDVEISEFLDLNFKKFDDKLFSGKNMLILKTDSDNLIFQLNWGPELKLKKKGVEKEYYYSRTSVSPMIFAIEKNKMNAENFKLVFKKKETNDTH
ncbi:MAG: DUF4340 domain-containing protein [Pseudobdellovibrio sp.]